MDSFVFSKTINKVFLAIAFIFLFCNYTHAQTYKAVYQVSFQAEDPMVNTLFSKLKSEKIVITNSRYGIAYSKIPDSSIQGLTLTTKGAQIDFLIKKQMKFYGIDTTAILPSDKILYVSIIKPEFEVLQKKDTVINNKKVRYIETKGGQSITKYFFDPDLPEGLWPYSMPINDGVPDFGLYKIVTIDLDNPSKTTLTATLKSVKEVTYDFTPFLKIVDNAVIGKDKIRIRRF